MDGMQQWPAEAIQLIKQLQQEIEDLKKRISQLENKIKVYENPHTPSSMQRFKGRTNGTNPPGKRGAPPGHYGATRIVPEPDEIIPVTMDQCPRCGSYLGNSIGIEPRTIEDLPPPLKIQVTQYDLHKYVCPGCGCEITARHQDCPMVGNLGISLMTQITMAKFHQRGVLRRIQEGLQGQNGFQFNPFHNWWIVVCLIQPFVKFPDCDLQRFFVIVVHSIKKSFQIINRTFLESLITKIIR